MPMLFTLREWTKTRGASLVAETARRLSRRTAVRWLFLLLLGFVLLGGADAPALDIVFEGRSDFVIVGDKASPAVKDLQAYIGRMTGATLPIVPAETSPAPDKAIVVGDADAGKGGATALAPQEYRLRVDGPKVVISGGGPDGVSHGVYGLLDDHWGCRFLTVKEDFVPRHATLSLPDALDERRGPSIRNRMWCMTGGLMDNPDWRRRNRMSCDIYGSATHNIYQWLPPDRYFKDHPDWYPMGKDGIRKPGCDWLCWSSQDMLTELTRLVREHMAKHAADQYVSLGQGDGFSSPCQCAACRAMVEKYGSEAAPIVAALNRLLAETVKEFPRHEVTFFAYGETGVPPVKGAEKLVPHPNLCATFVRMGDAMKPITHENNRVVRERILGWHGLTDNILVWSWSVGFNNSLCPFPNYQALAEDTKWYVSRVRGVMHQMYGDGEWYVLRQWLLARLMWDGSLDVEKTEKELLRCYYGEAAAKPLWQVVDRMQRAAAESTNQFNAVFDSKPANVQNKLFPPGQMAFCHEAFEEAIAAAEKSGGATNAARVADTMARSFAMLLFAQQPELRRVTIDGRDWMLPNGDSSLSRPAMALAEVLKNTIMWEWFGPELGRRKFMNNAGGPMELVENDKIRLGFCPALDGTLCSFKDRETDTEWLRTGPAGKGEQSGIHHTIRNSGASDHAVSVERTGTLTRVTLAGPAIVWVWGVFPALRHDRVYEFSQTRPGFSVKSYIYADSTNPAFWQYSHFKDPAFNLALDKPLYDPRVTMRFNAPSLKNLFLQTVSPGGVRQFQFDKTNSFQVLLPAGRGPEETLTLYVSGLTPDKTLAISTPWAEWDAITVDVDPSRQDLVLKFDGPKLESRKDVKTLASAFEVDLLSGEEAQRRRAVVGSSARDGGGDRPAR